ncbi:DUF2860 domain-containing protein [Vibrio sp. SCSIO 43169]|uniref:DUF2860 domain-containing protein n=1 Tax=Vibrio sp. SCSIO 43169 TaxID=2822801 RepID=UPI002043CA93|nr:DUF2860 domain-containing protein [Vibrio sp. SCSIO 43169]MCM5510102.1 DUF2860 domain-containing protein [Vibrio sp. SCSIO 43169]
MRSIQIIFALISLTQTSAASEQTSKRAGLSGELSLNFAYVSSESNLSTRAHSTIDNIEKAPKRINDSLLLPLGNIAFTFGQGLDKQVYAGTSRSDIAIGTLALEIGYKQILLNGMEVDVSYLPTVMAGETWMDPFVVGQPRQKTDERGSAYRIKLSNITAIGLTLDGAIAQKNIDDERSGLDSGYVDNASALARDADIMRLESSIRIPIGRTTLIVPSYIYTVSKANGSAQSFDSASGQLSLFHRFGQHQFALTGRYANRNYEDTHPIYNMTREDKELKLFAAYEYQNPMRLGNISFISFTGYEGSESNITFYDSSQMIASVGVSFRF